MRLILLFTLLALSACSSSHSSHSTPNAAAHSDANDELLEKTHAPIERAENAADSVEAADDKTQEQLDEIGG